MQSLCRSAAVCDSEENNFRNDFDRYSARNYFHVGERIVLIQKESPP